MIRDGQDWAELCRQYRSRLGLKQEAMAQDFGVDQSTVSRWERGTRAPNLAAKRAMLNTLLDVGAIGQDRSLIMMLEYSGSAVALWDQTGVLRGCSRRFRAEISRVGGPEAPIGQHADVLLNGHPIMNEAVRVLRERGFFRGDVKMATFSFRPMLNPARKAMGGISTATVFPVRLGPEDIAMLCIYDHDALSEHPDDDAPFSVVWIDDRDGHADFMPMEDAAPA